MVRAGSWEKGKSEQVETMRGKWARGQRGRRWAGRGLGRGTGGGRVGCLGGSAGKGKAEGEVCSGLISEHDGVLEGEKSHLVKAAVWGWISSGGEEDREAESWQTLPASCLGAMLVAFSLSGLIDSQLFS